MPTPYCQKYAEIDLSFLEGKKNPQLTACGCSQRYSAPDRMIYNRKFRLFWHQTSYMYAENCFDYYK